MCECGELGEFYSGFCMPEELADPFYEENAPSEKEEKISEMKISCCINVLHYA